MTCALSRQINFCTILEDFLPSSSEVPHARTSAAPTPRAKASKGKGPASSSKPSASSENADLVGSLLRTALISELGELTPCSLRWKTSATPAGRSWFVLQTSAPITSDPDAGSSDAMLHRLHTPTAMANMHNPSMEKWPSCQGWAEIAAGGMLPTPVTPSQQGGMRWEGGAGGRKVLKESGLWEVMHPPRETLPTPTKTKYGSQSYPEEPSRKRPSLDSLIGQSSRETLPTPTKSDAERMGKPAGPDTWAKAKGRRLTEHMAAGEANSSGPASHKWQYARQIAAILTEHGLSGASMTLPVVYGWMMGFPPGWLERALLSAVQEGLLPPASSSERMATR